LWVLQDDRSHYKVIGTDNRKNLSIMMGGGGGGGGGLWGVGSEGGKGGGGGGVCGGLSILEFAKVRGV